MDSTFSPFSRAKYFSIYEILINDKKIHGWHPSYTRSFTIRIASLASSCTVYHVQADGGGVWIEFHYSISFSFFFFFCDWFALTRVSFDLFDFNGKTFCTQSSSSMPIAMPHHLMPYMQRMHACNNVISVVFGRIFDVFSILLQQLLSLSLVWSFWTSLSFCSPRNLSFVEQNSKNCNVNSALTARTKNPQPKIQSKHKIIMNSSICDVIHQFLLKYLHQINALTLFLFIPNILNYIQVQWISHSCTKNQSMWIGPFVAVCLSCDSFVVVCRFHCNFQTIQIKSNWIEFHLIH